MIDQKWDEPQSPLPLHAEEEEFKADDTERSGGVHVRVHERRTGAVQKLREAGPAGTVPQSSEGHAAEAERESQEFKGEAAAAEIRAEARGLELSQRQEQEQRGSGSGGEA